MRLWQQIWRHSFGRFLIVGGGLALLYAALTAFFTSYLPGPKPLWAVMVWIALIPFGFHCQRRFTFRARQSRQDGLSLYAVSQLIGMAITAVLSWLFASGAFWPDLLLYLCASALAAVVSYAMARLVIFRP